MHKTRNIPRTKERNWVLIEEWQVWEMRETHSVQCQCQRDGEKHLSPLWVMELGLQTLEGM